MVEDASGHHHPRGRANAMLSPPLLWLLLLVLPSSTFPHTYLLMLSTTITCIAPTPRCLHHHCGYSNRFFPPPLPSTHIYQSANWLSPPPLPDSNQRQTIPYNLREHNPTPRGNYHHYSLLPFSLFPNFCHKHGVVRSGSEWVC
ncbi:hypothetical protein Fot_11908 [Forsythia ovata]|uniref:Secreted protein n=1 Tax=Forsythia ovata TaxID=205694 RepID=A0ABD1WL21_9LAMI